MEELISLTIEQQKHLNSVEWLINFDENIATGRTTVLAVAFIKRALKHSGEWVKVFDHYPQNKNAERHLLATIRFIIAKNRKLLEKTEFTDSAFMIK